MNAAPLFAERPALMHSAHAHVCRDYGGSKINLAPKTFLRATLRRQVVHRRPVDNVDSRVRSPTYGLKKMHGVLSRARLVRSRIQTGAPASWVVLVLSQLRNQLVHRPAAPVLKTVFPSRDCFDLRVAAGILSKSNDERKRGEAFPQSRLVSQTKQSHLTWCIGLQTRAAIRSSRDPGL